MAEFVGKALPLADAGISEATSEMGVTAAEIWAVIAVETSGCGFLADRRPQILFERHVFHRETNGRFDAQAPDLSNPVAGGYGAGGENQHSRLQRAIVLDRDAALKSTSWGLGQVMGFNAGASGFNSVDNLVASTVASEDGQLKAMAGFIIHNGLHRFLAANDWPSFALGYNGSKFRQNRYDTRLAASYQKLSHGVLPDLNVRAAQLFLMYLGHPPGPVDGLMGRLSRSALNDFQAAEGRPLTDDITGDDLALLRQRVEGLAA